MTKPTKPLPALAALFALSIAMALPAAPGMARQAAETPQIDAAAVPGAPHRMDGTALKLTDIGPGFIGPDHAAAGSIWQNVTQIDSMNGLFNTLVISPDAIAQTPLRNMGLRADDVIDIIILDPRHSWRQIAQSDGSQLWQAYASDGEQVSLRITGNPDVMTETTPMPVPEKLSQPAPMATKATVETRETGRRNIQYVTGAGHIGSADLLTPSSRLQLNSQNKVPNTIALDFAHKQLAGFRTISITADADDHVLIRNAKSIAMPKVARDGATRQFLLSRKAETVEHALPSLSMGRDGFIWFADEPAPDSAPEATPENAQNTQRKGYQAPPVPILTGNEHVAIKQAQPAPPRQIDLRNSKRDLILLRNDGNLKLDRIAYITGDPAIDMVLLDPHGRWDTPSYVQDEAGKQWLEMRLYAPQTGQSIMALMTIYSIRLDPALSIMTLPQPALLSSTADLRSRWPGYPGIKGRSNAKLITYTRGGPIWVNQEQQPDLFRIEAINGLPNTIHVSAENAWGNGLGLRINGDQDLDQVSLDQPEAWRREEQTSTRTQRYTSTNAAGQKVTLLSSLPVIEDVPDIMDAARQEAEAADNMPGTRAVLEVALERGRIKDELGLGPHHRALLIEAENRMIRAADQSYLAIMDKDKLALEAMKLGMATGPDGAEIGQTRALLLMPPEAGTPRLMAIAGDTPGANRLMALALTSPTAPLAGQGYGIVDGLITAAQAGNDSAGNAPLLLTVAKDANKRNLSDSIMALDSDGINGPLPPRPLPRGAISESILSLSDGQIALFGARLPPPMQRANNPAPLPAQWLLFMDRAGKINRSFDWPEKLHPQTLAALPNGDILVAGNIKNIPTPQSPSTVLDPYVARLGPDGSIKALREFETGGGLHQIAIPARWQFGADGKPELLGAYMKDPRAGFTTFRLQLDDDLSLIKASLWVGKEPVLLLAEPMSPQRPESRLWLANRGQQIMRSDVLSSPEKWEDWPMMLAAKELTLTPLPLEFGAPLRITPREQLSVAIEPVELFLRTPDEVRP